MARNQPDRNRSKKPSPRAMRILPRLKTIDGVISKRGCGPFVWRLLGTLAPL